MMTSDRPEVEIQPFRACAMRPAIIIGTVRSSAASANLGYISVIIIIIIIIVDVAMGQTFHRASC